ncbi:MAG: FHA domain-containing protein [Thermoflexales bacterium]|nr:FHA domain-containing protein [Thermoflexales bacterium]
MTIQSKAVSAPGRLLRCFQVVLLAVCLAGLGLGAGFGHPPTVTSAQTNATYFIDDVDATRFPTVSFRLRAVDLNNKVVTGLTSANLPVYENGKQVPAANVTITPRDDGPMTIFFVVDQGANALYNNFSAFSLGAMRKSMSRLVEGGFFREGRDRVKVLVRENIPINNDRTVPRLDTTSKASEFTNFLSIYTFDNSKGGLTKGLDAVSEALRGINEAVPEPGRQATAVVLITNYIEDPAAATATTFAGNLAAQAKSSFVTLYAMQTNAQQFNRAPLDALVLGSFGRYAPLTNSTVDSLADDIYRTISAQRLSYQVSYVSTSGDTGTRTVTVGGPEAPAPGAGGRAGTYSAKAVPAAVRLDGLPTSALRREARPGSSVSNPQYDPLTLKVSATISYTDGIVRPLTEARLLVNNVLKSTQTQFAPGTTRVDFTVDLSDITTPGVNNVTVGVRIKDSLGIESGNQDRVVVDVARAPEPTATPTPVPKGVFETGEGIVAMVVAAVVLGLGLGLGVFALARRSKAARPRAEMRVMSSGPAPGGASLIVADGPPSLRGRQIALDKIEHTLGRGEQADLQLWAGQESSISRVHARLHRDGSGTFFVTDLGSSNGTRIGARPLNPNQPYPLQNGDEIILGDLQRNGARLIFNTGGVMPSMPGGYAPTDDRTRVRM